MCIELLSAGLFVLVITYASDNNYVKIAVIYLQNSILPTAVILNTECAISKKPHVISSNVANQGFYKEIF